MGAKIKNTKKEQKTIEAFVSYSRQVSAVASAIINELELREDTI